METMELNHADKALVWNTFFFSISKHVPLGHMEYASIKTVEIVVIL